MLIRSKHCGYLADGTRTPFGGKGASVDPQVGAALLKQGESADRMMDWIIKSYDENAPLREKTMQQNDEDRLYQRSLADKSEARAEDQYSFYQSNRPMVQKALQDANEWDSEDNQNEDANKAGGDVAQAFANAEQQQARSLGRLGITPDSGKFAALNNQMSIQKAAATAGAQNNARAQRRVQGVGMRQNAANIAQGMQSTSMGWSGQGAGAGMNANGIGNQNLSLMQGSQGTVANGFGQASQLHGSNAQGYQSAVNSSNQQSSNMWGGIGQLAGTAMMAFADGGEIEGPGTGTSDSVKAVNGDTGQPIRLSNGEYIISKDVVDAKGVEFFDKLQARYHKPTGNGNLRSA